MKLVISLLLCIGLCSTLAVSAAVKEESTAENLVNNIWKVILKVKEAVEPVVRYGAARAQAFVSGEQGSRGARATNVTIINRTNKNLVLALNHCNSGKFSSGMLPPEILPATSEKKYGTESTLGRGAECKVKYASQDGSWVSVETSNPYFESNRIHTDSSSDLRLEQNHEPGYYNKVVVKISNAF